MFNEMGTLMERLSRFQLGVRIILSLSAPIIVSVHCPAGDTKKQIEFFLGTCFGSLDDISRVKSLAALLKWQNAPAEFANLGKPVNGGGYESWVVRRDGEFYVVAVNQAPWVDEKLANVCSVVVESPRDAVLTELTRMVKLKKIHEEHEPLQTTYYFEYDSSAVERAMVSVAALDNGTAPVSLGVTGIRKKH